MAFARRSFWSVGALGYLGLGLRVRGVLPLTLGDFQRCGYWVQSLGLKAHILIPRNPVASRTVSKGQCQKGRRPGQNTNNKAETAHKSAVLGLGS